MTFKSGANAGQFQLIYEDRSSSDAMKARATALVELQNDFDFVKFEIHLNEIPIGNFKGQRNTTEFAQESDFERGKDVVIDWEFLDGFQSDNNLWIDSNGLDMH